MISLPFLKQNDFSSLLDFSNQNQIVLKLETIGNNNCKKVDICHCQHVRATQGTRRKEKFRPSVWSHLGPTQVFCSRIIHEAFQFLIMKKKKLSGRSMAHSWNIVGGKAGLMGLLNRVEDRDQAGVESAQSKEADDKRNTKQ